MHTHGPRRRRRLAPPLTLLAALLVAMLPAGPALADATVNIPYEGGDEPYVYDPETVNIGVGESVTWVNPSGNPLEPAADHPTYCGTPGTKGECPWSSFPLSPGESATVEFPTEGTFGYACAIHPYMTGWVIVGDGEPDAAPEPEQSDPEPEPEPTESEASDEPTDEEATEEPSPDDDATDEATEDASEDEDVFDEPSDDATTDDGPAGPRDALSGIGGTVTQEPGDDTENADAPTSDAGGNDEGDGLTPEERAGQDSPTGFRSLITLSVMGILAGGGALVLRNRRG